ncbi:MAG: GLUG motif-containing protein [bacterium]
MLLAFIVTMLPPLPAGAAALRVIPHTVVEQDDFNEDFLLTLEDDSFLDAPLPESLSLGGDFEGLNVSEVVYTDSTTVIAKIYGELKHNTGTGTITLAGQALESGADATVAVAVEQKNVPDPDATVIIPEQEDPTGESTVEPELLRIEIASLPDKTRYYVGEELELTGLVVIGIYSDDTEEELPITLDNISGFDSSEAALGQEVMVVCGDQRASFTVDILAQADLMAMAGEGDFAGGSGTEDDPYQIATPEQLALVHRDLTACYELIADIDLEGYLSEEGEGYNEGGGWVPIGSAGNPFQGSFNGNGYVIRNLTINRPEEAHYIGFFGRTEDADLRDIKLENVNVSGHNEVGGLVGYMKEGTIVSCHVSGSVQGGNNRIGGLVGANYGGEIFASSAEVEVTASGELSMSAGGLVGLNEDGSISDSHAGGDVFGDSYVGGLVGENLAFSTFSLISSSAARGRVSGSYHVGGLVGSNNGSIIMDTYAVGPAEGVEDVGGLVGTNANGSVFDSFAVGSVTGERLVGGLAGANSGKIYSSYYDQGTTGQEDTGKGEPRTTAEMQLRSTYVDWDFIDVWGIEDGSGYPLLRWQEEAPQSGFAVEAENSWAEPGREIQLEITDAKDADGKLLEGSCQVTVYSDVEKKNVFQDDVEFADGEALVSVTLTTAGKHNLRIFVEGVSYSDLVTIDVLSSVFAGGSGTPEDPFLIADVDQLSQVRYLPTAHFRLNSDIDLGTPPYNEGEGWEPIGNELEPFEGSFDGSGKVIKNLYINRSDEKHVGLFGCVEESGTLLNVRLENVNVFCQDFGGGLVGDNYGSIQECYAVKVNISGEQFVGGLVGANNGYVEDCYATGAVTGKESVGGLAGYNDYGFISGCYATAAVVGQDGVGGLVGYNDGSVIYSYAAGNVEGKAHVGGLIGNNEDGVSKSYATGSVAGVNNVGGLVGTNDTFVQDCYATGAVEGNEHVGGLVGLDNGVIYGSYYDSCTTGQRDTGKGEPMPTEKMQLRSTFEGWDFLGVWCIEDEKGYPMLWWQEGAPKSGFAVEAVDSWATPDGELRLKITDAKGESGALLTGSYQVTIYSDLEGIKVYQANAEFNAGEVVITVAALSTVGTHNLRIFVEGISYSNLVTIDVLIPGFAGGTGTSEDPFLIADAVQLNQVRYFLTAHFKLIRDINLGTAPYNQGKGWEQIGQSQPFRGGFDGGGYVIKNLTIDRPGEVYIGLFGITQDAVLHNIKLENVNVSGKNHVGGLVGYMEEGTIESCHVSGSVKGDYNVGGLVGTIEAGHVFASSASVKVTGHGHPIDNYSNAGGLVGENFAGVISNSHAAGEVYGQIIVGGLVGENLYGSVLGSSAEGKVTGALYVGGLAGNNYYGSINGTSAAGTVTGYALVGGLVGDSECGSVIDSCAGAEVAGEYFAGGLIGVMEEGIMSGCFVDEDGVVTGAFAVGGLVGYVESGEITNAYSKARVTGVPESYDVGGLVGTVGCEYGPATIAHCFAAGPVAGDYDVGGLVGYNEDGDIRACYYDRETTGRSAHDNQWGIPKTTAEMKQQATFEGWDFDSVWGIVEGYTYPYLKWQDQTGFTVALAQAGDKKAGQAFAVSITNATDISGVPLKGEVKVAVASDLEEGEVYSGLVHFENGNATVPVTLDRPGEHSLSVAVAGVPGKELLRVNVKAGGGRSSTARDDTPRAKLYVTEERVRVSIPAELDSRTGVAVGAVDAASLKEAFAKTKANEQGIKLVEIAITEVDGAKANETILPVGVLTEGDTARAVKINTGIGAVTVPGNMLSETVLADAETFSLTIATADKSTLPPTLQLQIGDRPVIELGLKIGGERVSWHNEDAPVTVRIPYRPTKEELADPEHITVWYIDGEGNVAAVPSGRYDPVTGTVTFSTTHFSKYAVVYVTKTFADLERVPWAKKQIEVLASKGIVKGLSETEYAPQEYITRGDFLYSLVRALGLTADFAENYADVKENDYYYREICIAKKFGITKGTGNNRFSPEASISRQDMMVLAEKALRLAKSLEAKGSPADLEKFADKSLIADYAVDSIASLVKEGLIVGSEGKVNPLGNTTRAEAAALLYRIYNSYSY